MSLVVVPFPDPVPPIQRYPISMRPLVYLHDNICGDQREQRIFCYEIFSESEFLYIVEIPQFVFGFFVRIVFGNFFQFLFDGKYVFVSF